MSTRVVTTRRTSWAAKEWPDAGLVEQLRRERFDEEQLDLSGRASRSSTVSCWMRRATALRASRTAADISGSLAPIGPGRSQASRAGARGLSSRSSLRNGSGVVNEQVAQLAVERPSLR